MTIEIRIVTSQGSLTGPFELFGRRANNFGAPLLTRMGRHKGSARKLRPSGLHFDEQHEELVWNLIEAYPDAVPYDQCHHLSTGELAQGMTAANTVCDVRRKFGKDIIETVRLVGYKATPRLIAAAKRVLGGAHRRRHQQAASIMRKGPSEALAACDRLDIHPQVRRLVDKALRDVDVAELLEEVPTK